MRHTKDWVATASKEERQQHVKLDEVCLERGGNSTQHRGILVQFLDTDFPEGAGRIILAHACGNGKCSNPRHLYWATDRENIVEDGRKFGTHMNPWERSVAKYGLKKARELNSRGDKAAGGRAGKGKTLSAEHKQKISDAIRKKHAEKN
jgi:hypothetical protein